ncbi:MAG: 3-dehydroquinate synthase [Chloroflexi bacterium]|nr:3-dehydroquinate synthase [Chloroflexota bacterium]
MKSQHSAFSTQHSALPVTHPTGEYTVLVGRGLLGRLPELAPLPCHVALVMDENVAPLYGALVAEAIGRERVLAVTVPAGEAHKTLETVRDIYDKLLDARLDRQTTILAVGGGVVNDMAGFVAATYLRGVAFVTCPTTLLAMVDASVGGKTGVDVPQGKNLIGAFMQPTAVIADVDTLATLPPAELSAGMAEVIKHGLLAGGVLWAELGRLPWPLPAERWGDLVATAVQVKRDVVQEDPFERGRRALLNLGHTFAHAIEQVSQYAVAHGPAVAMGLACAAHLSAQLGHCAPNLPTDIEQLLTRCQLPTRIPAHLPAEALLAAMGSDKKKADGRLRFVLLRTPGEAFLEGDVPLAAVRETLNSMSKAQ